jgi:hypothetical protein
LASFVSADRGAGLAAPEVELPERWTLGGGRLGVRVGFPFARFAGSGFS